MLLTMRKASNNSSRKFIQAAGHRDSIQLDTTTSGRLLKAHSENEVQILKLLNSDPHLCEFVPKYYETREFDENKCPKTIENKNNNNNASHTNRQTNSQTNSQTNTRNNSLHNLQHTIRNNSITNIIKQNSIINKNKKSEGFFQKTIKWMVIEDLTVDYVDVQLLDVKMGRITYDVMEKGVSDKFRSDLFEKLKKEKDNTLTKLELERGTITKERYLNWRDHQSTTGKFGYRFEGIQSASDEKVKTTGMCRDPDEARVLLRKYLEYADECFAKQMVSRLERIKQALEKSTLTSHLRMIGVSLLFMYDRDTTFSCMNVGMIDFGKVKWVEEANDDLKSEWLFGLTNLIDLFKRYSKRPGST